MKETTSKEYIYNDFLKKSLSYYYSDKDLKKFYNTIPKQRDYTFCKCLKYFKDYEFINIVELGTSRSFVDGRYPGACDPCCDVWEPESIHKWDWSSGLFTKYFSDVLKEKEKKFKITTVDISPTSIEISKKITENNKSDIEYVVSSSEDFIESCGPKSIDFLYIDTGNMDEQTAELHLREAKLIINKKVLKDDGLMLIDDIKNPFMIMNGDKTNLLGKAKYSLSYFLEHGYKIVCDEYQVILQKEAQNDT